MPTTSMPKKSKKSGKKNVAKRTAASAQHHKQAESAMSAVAPDRLRAVASRWGTIVSLLIIAVLAGLYWSTNPENCHSLSRYEPMWTFLSKYGIVQRPTEATMAHVCSRVHSATHACLFLSGGTDSATNKVHNGFTSAWNWAGHFFGKTSASDVTYAPSVLYKRDPRDVLFAVTWGVALLALRGVLMSTLLLPVARRLVKRPPPEKWVQAGHQRKYYRSIDRFAEQFWICILYATSLALVVVCFFFFLLTKAVSRRQPFWFWNPEQLWVGYPHTTMDGLTKAVYLWEASNYIHQLFVINIEARRSDYLQMTVHHIVTMLLIGGSYACCFWRIGLVILLLMDPSDVLLAVCIPESNQACQNAEVHGLADHLRCHVRRLHDFVDHYAAHLLHVRHDDMHLRCAPSDPLSLPSGPAGRLRIYTGPLRHVHLAACRPAKHLVGLVRHDPQSDLPRLDQRGRHRLAQRR